MTGNELKTIREKLRLTQKTLGVILGYKNPAVRVNELENGRVPIVVSVENFMLALEYMHEHRIVQKFYVKFGIEAVIQRTFWTRDGKFTRSGKAGWLYKGVFMGKKKRFTPLREATDADKRHYPEWDELENKENKESGAKKCNIR